jgi:hypothetical protein
MDEFDRLGIESVIQAMVGHAEAIRFRTGNDPTPMNIFTDLGARRLGRPVTVIWVDGGLPGHFTLEGRPDLPVIFHSGQVERSAWVRNLYVDTVFQESMRPDLAESLALRLIAEFLLVHGKVDQALQCLAKSKQAAGGVILSQPKIMPNLEHAPVNEAYMTLWFHGLGHEFGHHIDEDQYRRVCSLPFLGLDSIESLIKPLSEIKYAEAADRHLFGTALEEWRAEGGQEFFLSAELLRTEAIADIFAAALLIEATRVVFQQVGKLDVDGRLLLFEILISMACLSLIQECKIMASWFTNLKVAEQQTLALSAMALQVRTNLFIGACRSPEVPKIFGDFFSFDKLPDVFDWVSWQSERFLSFATGIGKARAFLYSPSMKNTDLFYDFVGNLSFAHVADVRDFVRLATQLNLSTPELELLKEAVREGTG